MVLEFSGQIFEKYSNIKFYEIRPVGVDLFHADGQICRHDVANSAYRNFANAHKNTVCFLL
jgi:hypothetical protein